MIRSIILVLVVAALLVACGGDDTTTTTDPTTTTSTAPAPSPTTTAAAAGGDVVPVEVEPCALLTADDVGGATGLAAAVGREDGMITCVFDIGADSGVAVFVAIDDGLGRLAGPASLYAAYVEEGAEALGVELSEHISIVLQAMQGIAEREQYKIVRRA